MVDLRFGGRADVARELAALREVAVNYELQAPPTTETGWRLDDYCLRLPPEPPGEPLAHGSYAVAARLVRDYAFADPAIIRAVWDPASPLAGRDMLLQGRFGPLRFLLGVRVSDVVDETSERDGHPIRVWGWCYRTLQGHLEAGEMCYRVEKRLDTGEVVFRVHRYLRSEQVEDRFVRLGWALFGRAMQVLFVRRSLTRMRRLVDAELLLGRGAGHPSA